MNPELLIPKLSAYFLRFTTITSKRNNMRAQTLLVILTTLLSAHSFTAAAQDFTITNGTVNTCTGLFHDDGGPGGGPYTTTNYTFTICPDNPDDVVQVDFFAFNLWTSPNPNNSDRLFIFDGPNAGAPGLGSYTGSQLQGLQVTATINNPSGCLTFVFQANPNGNTGGTFPGWEAAITCTTPCAPPTSSAVIQNPAPDGPEQIIGACIGDPITFADNGSFAEPGFNIATYRWNFADGVIDTTSGPQVTHIFDEPGEYIVTLTVIDDNGCSSLNLEPLQVLISTIPIFNIDHDLEICLGESATLDGSAVQSQTWTALPPQVVSGETFLADGAGFTYSTDLTFDFFEPGATLQTCDDLIGVFVNMEHSYLGDLGMSITCPDGTTVSLMDWPNGGGGTYMGEAVDDPYDLPGQNVPGVGYTYTWSPDATNGNLADQPPNMVAFTTQTGTPLNQDIVPEGTYQADGNLCDLVGCPLNGSWTLTITDNLGIDNGYVFFWGIDINPSYFPDVTTFTPVIGMGTDSTFWTGPNISPVSADGNIVSFTPDAVGQYDFTFSAINNFGCVQDTTVSVTVTPGPEVDAGDDLVICTDSLQLSGGIAGVPPPPDNCDYTLEMLDTFGDGWNGFSVTILQDGVVVGTYTFPTGTSSTATINLNHGATIQINATGGTFDNEVSYNLINPAGEIVFSDGEGFGSPQTGTNVWTGTVDCQPESPDYVFQWSPATGLSNPNIANPMVFVDQTTEYTLTVYEADHPLCATSDVMTVVFIPNLNPGEDTTVEVCYFEDAFSLDGLLEGDPTPGGVWTDQNGNEVNPAEFDPADLAGGGETVFTYTVGADDCEFSSTLTIVVQTSAENADCCITNAVVGEDFSICGTTAVLSAEEPLGTGTWTSNPAGAVFANPNDPNTSVTVPTGGIYTFTFTDNNGVNCAASDEMSVHFSPSFAFTINEITDPACAGACNGTVNISVTGGIAPISYNWSGGTSDPGNPGFASGFCSGNYGLLVTDAIGCTDTVSFMFDDPPPPPVEATMTPAQCFGDCNGSISIFAPEGVFFTFDGGETYGSESFLDSLCAGIYSVGLIDIFGCENFTNVTVTAPAPLVADFSYSPNPISLLFPLVQFTDESSPGPIVTHDWTFGAGTVLGTSDEANPEFEFPSDTARNYEVILIVSDENGCVDTTAQFLFVKDEFLLYIPNTFTPNGDGLNEVWKPKGNNVSSEDYHLRIFDRYGHLVFETRDFNEGWNGDINSSDYYGTDGVYVYVIEAKSASTLEKKEFKGHINLLR